MPNAAVTSHSASPLPLSGSNSEQVLDPLGIHDGEDREQREDDGENDLDAHSQSTSRCHCNLHRVGRRASAQLAAQYMLIESADMRFRPVRRDASARSGH